MLGEAGNEAVHAKIVFIVNCNEGAKSTVSAYGEILRERNDDGSPAIRPGFRVPLFVVSPCTHSPDGIVYSELADHTFVLQFVEERLGVKYPNINPWRRLVMVNVLYAFDWDNPNYTFQILPDTSNSVSESDYQCNNLPSQETGTKISRALPYSFDILDNVVLGCPFSGVGAKEKFNITMKHTGDGGVVLHVCNYFDMTQDPRKYTIDTGKSLCDLFDIDSDTGKYNYSLRGLHSYVRQFAGSSLMSELVRVEMKEYGESKSINFIFK